MNRKRVLSLAALGVLIAVAVSILAAGAARGSDNH